MAVLAGCAGKACEEGRGRRAPLVWQPVNQRPPVHVQTHGPTRPAVFAVVWSTLPANRRVGVCAPAGHKQHVLLIASACSLLVGVYGVRCVVALRAPVVPLERYRHVCISGYPHAWHGCCAWGGESGGGWGVPAPRAICTHCLTCARHLCSYVCACGVSLCPGQHTLRERNNTI